MPPKKVQGANLLKVGARRYVDQGAMTGRNTSPTTAAGVVDNTKQVLFHAVAVVVVSGAFSYFLVALYAKVPPVARLTRVPAVALLSTPYY